jgi:5S rRNA maturation endonuclease (ribonuclease M5)
MGLTEASLFNPSTREKPKGNGLTLVKTYNYHDENGELLFQKLRYVDGDGKKTFRQRKPDGNGGWEYALGDTPKVLYNLPAVRKAVLNNEPVWVVEGEKDADTLTELGYVATTMPGGAGKWLDIHTEALKGGVVDIIADNDEPGREHARKVYEELSKAGCDVAVWSTPRLKDVSDFLGAGGQLSELVDASSAEISPVEEPAPDKFGDAVQKIAELLTRDDLSAQQILVKATSIATSIKEERIVDPGRLVDWSEFVRESDDDSYDWVIEGLLERGERVIIVAAEGVGKTMLARQVAILSANGIHPFTYQRMKQIRTLTVDLENPERIIRRTSRRIMEAAIKRGYAKKPDAHLVVKPAGLDLLTSTDRRVLEDHIEAVKPELLVMGPLYKSFVDPGGRTSEAVAVEIAKYLDYIRDTYKCALWLEHHAPLGTSMSTRDLRPFGSAVWSRWPEFGLSLTPDLTSGIAYTYDVKHFRGARDERQWPTKMKRGTLFPFEVIDFMKVGS